MNRRQFLGVSAAAIAGPGIRADQTDWGGPVLDLHLHPRRAPATEWEHMQGCGVTMAVLLPQPAAEPHCKELVAQHPDRFRRFTNADVRKPGSIDHLRATVKDGAIGFGELKYQVALDGPEMRRVYELAAELQVPVLMHFQENGPFNSGIQRFPAIARQYSRTIFLAHANSWWAYVSADTDDSIDYPSGKIKPGGLSDRMLSEFPNVYGDLSANSGRNCLQRDPDFAADFVARHQDKLIFGSDCGCRDGHGTGQPQAPLGGKCTAQETLGTLKKLTSAEVFRKITWTNGTRLLKIPA